MRRASAAFLLLGLLASAPVQASDVQRVGPGNVATSSCIGEAGSARCAADTLMACIARAARPLCARVGAEPPEPMPPPRLIHYVVERESTIRQDQITDDLQDVSWFKPGYVLLEILIRGCSGDEAACDNEPWEDLQVYARLQGNAWRIVHWRAPGDPDDAPLIPEAFRPSAN
jgi:hypothetical protein